MTYIFLGFFLGAVTSYAFTRYYYEKVIDEWRILYDKCRCEMDRLYKLKDELHEKLREKK